MINYQKVFVKLINNQLEKLETAAKKNKTGTTLRVALNIENMLHELFPTIR